MGNGDSDNSGPLDDRQLLRSLRRIAVTADPPPSEAAHIARALLTWRTVDIELGCLLDPEASGQPPPGGAGAGACRARCG